MSDFCNVDNMKLCLTVFDKYMNDRFNINVKTLKDTDLKKELYNIMIILIDSPDFMKNTIKQKNNIAINEMKNLYVEKYKIIENKKIHIKNLDRENILYGDRELISNPMKPEITNLKGELNNATVDFELLQKERGFEKDDNNNNNNNNNNDNAKIQSEIIASISSEEMTKRLKEHQESRNSIFSNTIPSDPKILLQKELEEKTNYDVDLIDKDYNNINNINNNNYTNFSKQLVIEKPISTIKQVYISICGHDRDLNLYPSRYNFTIDFNNLINKYKNIVKLSFTNLIIPANIDEGNNLSESGNKGFGLNSPYINLNIGEFTDLYDGFSDVSRNCFTQFLFDKSYKTSNGRGYVTMKPSQSEEKLFNPVLSSLQRLNISINRPNGTLLNYSKDSNSILKIEYEVYNSNYLKVITNKFFEKNEFYTGDIVFFDKFKMPMDLESTDYNENRGDYNKIMEFINRKEGHEILEIGKANENGFFRSFYIDAFLIFDENCGKMVTDKELLDLIHIYNINNVFDAKKINGTIVNSSLQFNMTCKIDIEQY